MIAQRLQRGFGVTLRIAVADDHRDVAADAFGAERRGRKRRRHRKEIDGPAVARAENRGQLGAADVDAVDHHVGQSGGRSLRRCAERVARVGDDQLVHVARIGAAIARRRVAPSGTTPMTRPAGRRACLACAHDSKPLLPSAPTTTTVWPVGAETSHLRGRAGDVEHRECDAFVDVVREAAPKGRSKKVSLCRAPDSRPRRRRRARSLRCAAASASARRATRCGRRPQIHAICAVGRRSPRRVRRTCRRCPSRDCAACRARDVLGDVFGDALARRSRTLRQSA